jgi:hypothetical protein
MQNFTLDEESIYAAKVGVEDWYRIPLHLVKVFLKSGATVKELPKGGAWKTLSNDPASDAVGE